MSSRSNINWFQVTIWILLVEMIGMASALLSGNIREMYHSLTLPAFSPSGGVFGIVWPILYLFIGIVGYITWQNRQTHVMNYTPTKVGGFWEHSVVFRTRSNLQHQAILPGLVPSRWLLIQTDWLSQPGKY